MTSQEKNMFGQTLEEFVEGMLPVWDTSEHTRKDHPTRASYRLELVCIWNRMRHMTEIHELADEADVCVMSKEYQISPTEKRWDVLIIGNTRPLEDSLKHFGFQWCNFRRLFYRPMTNGSRWSNETAAWLDLGEILSPQTT